MQLLKSLRNSPWRAAIAPLLVLWVSAVPAWSRTFRVPADAPTIQAGLDSLAENDTVLVALGIYAEALQAPALPFVLRGDVLIDTGDYPRPIIDPASLPGSDHLACLTLPHNSGPVIENIRFRNGAAMYPHSSPFGGVGAGGPAATFRRCVFDSTYRGIYRTNACALELRECRFLKVADPITSSSYPGFIWASDCVFEGTRSGTLIPADVGCILERCQFGCTTSGFQCRVGGHVEIRDCRFGPCEDGVPYLFNPSITADYTTVGTIEHNQFTGLYLMGYSVITHVDDCNDSLRLVIRNNTFADNISGSSAQGAGVVVQCRSTSISGMSGVTIDSNRFESNHITHSPVWRSVSFNRAAGRASANRFHDLTWDQTVPVGPPPVVSSLHAPASRLRANRFDSTGLALLDSVSWDTDSLDARLNWWGSGSGPYNAETNPDGGGDTVLGSRVLLVPWCTDTALCSEPATASPFIPHPTAFFLSAYPNPFNSTTLLHLEVPEPQIVRVDLYNLLGKRVQELWSGVVADRREIAFDGNALASGIYFVRATNTIWNRPLISTKLVLLK